MKTKHIDFIKLAKSIKLIQDFNAKPLNEVAQEFSEFSNQQISDEIIDSFARKGLNNEDFLMSDFLTKYGIKTLFQVKSVVLNRKVIDTLFQKCEQFVATLMGVYQPNLTDTELTHLLHKKLIEEILQFRGLFIDKPKMGNIAYKIAVAIFEGIEYKQSRNINGHHQAQKFADVFNPHNE